MAVLVLVIVVALWYFFVRREKCKTSSDCKSDEVCSGGYCKSKGS